MSNSNLKLDIPQGGAVTCLGRDFANEQERRQYFAEELRKFLKTVDRSQFDGFPEGSDEDIILLSNPPYYTACPNPFLAELINEAAPDRAYVPYSRGPLADDVIEGKNDPLYGVPSYHTKVPPKAIRKYILHYTQPGDVVLDLFAGTGMTGVAASLAATKQADDPKSVEHGYRQAILVDLSPAATFIASIMAAPIDPVLAQGAGGVLSDIVAERVQPLYAFSPQSPEQIDYGIWSDWGLCSECNQDFRLYDVVIDWDTPKILDQYPCPHCGATNVGRKLTRSFETIKDPWTGEVKRRARTTLVAVSKKQGNRAVRRPATDFDTRTADAARAQMPTRVPEPLRYSHMTHERNNLPKYWGVDHVHEFFTSRNYLALDKLTTDLPGEFYRAAMFCAITTIENNTTRRNRFYVDKRRPKGSPIGPLSNTLYIPTLQVEANVGIKALQVAKSAADVASRWSKHHAFITTQSSTDLSQLPDACVDFIFTDPPFGGNINYSEQNMLYEWWTGLRTNNKKEAITNSVQAKGVGEYTSLMNAAFRECHRLLKPGRYIVVEFHNSSNAIWNAIQFALGDAGFVIANVALLDKVHTTLHQDSKAAAVDKDLAITAYKPNGGLEERFALKGGTEESVWDFVSTHLKYLPVTTIKKGGLEFVGERSSRVIFDRMVGWMIQHNTLVPVSFAEFQAGLEARFAERDGMYFLATQVGEYDKRALESGGPKSRSLFVDDERTAIDWITEYLKQRPSTYQELFPEFTKQLGISWRKHEERPELTNLLDQNFLIYDGDGPVPPQVHSHLSSNWKELRNLDKSNPQLVEKARNRWFVPDPNKQQDVEARRDKALLREFDIYKAHRGKKMKEIRLEVMRVGFKAAWAAKDYRTIIDVSAKVPDEVWQEDERLMMLHSMAETRLEAER